MGYVAGLYTGVQYVAYAIETPEDVAILDENLQRIVDQNFEDSIISIFMIPQAFYRGDSNPALQTFKMDRPTAIRGYGVPRNKKLLTYPYMFANVDTLNDSHNYRFEWSDMVDRSITFAMFCAISPNPEIVTYPENYNGVDVVEGAPLMMYNGTESVTCSGFPQCAFCIDSYRAWLAQKSNMFLGATALSVASNAVTGGLRGGVVGAGVGALTGLVTSVGSDFSANVLKASEGNRTRGTVGSSTDVGSRVKKIYFKIISVDAQHAQIIDDFFDRFGYKSDKIKVPNRNVRQRWTYTKTTECNLTGNVPHDDLEKIRSIYNNGITFWNNPYDVGHYEKSNGVLTNE